MTHIDVGDDNSKSEQNMVHADRAELEGPLRPADFSDADAARSLIVWFAIWTIPSLLQPGSSLGLVANFFTR